MGHLLDTTRATAPSPCNDEADGSNNSIEIWFLVLLTGFLLLILVIFGSHRRRWSNSTFRNIMFIAYIAPTYVLTYALCRMRKSKDESNASPVWAMLLLVILGSSDSFAAYSLEDNEQWKKYNWVFLMKFVWLALLLKSHAVKSHEVKSHEVKSHAVKSHAVTMDIIAPCLVPCLIGILVLKFHERALALAAASRRSLERSTKVIVDFVLEKHRERSAVDAGDFDMKNCYYLVRGEEDKWQNILVIRHFKWWKEKMMRPERALNYPARPPVDVTRNEVITLGKVWNCQGRLLSSDGDPDNKLKDYCLSFALFKLLRLEYAGYTLPHEVHQETWNLFQKELLSQQADGHRRAFRVLEIELSYLFDFLYTKYGVIFYPGRLYLKLVEIAYFIAGISAVTTSLEKPRTVDDWLSAQLIMLFLSVEVVQFFFTFFSEWAKLICICEYVQRESWQKKKWIEWMVRFICWVRILRPWERKLRQYSFLEFYSYRPCRLIYNRISASYIDEKRNGQGQSKPIKLSEDVTKVVFDTLKSNSGANLENGKVSLQRNNVSEQLSWACELQTQTQVILVWHIATSFCEQRQEGHKFSPNSPKTGTTTNFRIASNLSKYLAYLVVFAPQLLPDHTCTAENVFDRAVLEAEIFFKNCKCKCKCKSKKRKMEARIEKMNEQGRPSPEEQTVIKQGAWLGKQLVDEVKDEAQIWQILAEFWAEMMLYVAPSDNARAHAEQLAVGGEFVTHLWALLSHAGIKRSVPSGAN